MRRFALLTVGLLLGGCVLGDPATDPTGLAAREVHAGYITSDKGFGLDPNRQVFYDSFEDGSLTKWTPTNASGDAWSVSTKQTNFGLRSLTYGNQDVITQAVDFPEATLATKDAISLAKVEKPVLLVFGRFERQGATTDQTAFKVEVSPDLGFSWQALTPEGATDSVIAAPADPERAWKRYRYDLAAFAGQAVRLKLSLKASLSDRKLLYLDDVLVVETK